MEGLKHPGKKASSLYFKVTVQIHKWGQLWLCGPRKSDHRLLLQRNWDKNRVFPFWGGVPVIFSWFWKAMVTWGIDILESGHIEANVAFGDMEQMTGLLIPKRFLSSEMRQSGRKTLSNPQIATGMGKLKNSRWGDSLFLSLKICWLLGCHDPRGQLQVTPSALSVLFAPSHMSPRATPTLPYPNSHSILLPPEACHKC